MRSKQLYARVVISTGFTWNIFEAGALVVRSHMGNYAEMPEHYIKPMLCREVDELPTGPAWLFELEYDGVRVQASKHDDEVNLLTREGQDLSGVYPQLVRAMKRIRCRTCTLDGELYSGAGRFGGDTSQGVLPAPDECIYQCFDVLEVDGESLLDLTLGLRRRHLKQLVPRRCFPLCASALIENVPTFMEGFHIEGLIGIVAKRRHSKYRPGRNGCWVKWNPKR